MKKMTDQEYAGRQAEVAKYPNTWNTDNRTSEEARADQKEAQMKNEYLD